MYYEEEIIANTDDVQENFQGKDKRRAARRKKDTAKAMRKRRLCREVHGNDWYKSLHEYSKNKIHCSCGMCRFRSVFDPDNKPMSDIRKLASLKDQELEWMASIA